jgi:3-hydroxyisobutyrate dehydrogenase
MAAKELAVGFMGLGSMGYPIAARLLRRAPNLAVWNKSESVASKHATAYGSRAVAFDDMASAGVVFMCLPSTDESGQLCRALAAIATGPITFVDLSSGNFEDSRRIEDDMRTKNCRYIDSPVSGGPAGASEGIVTSMVGAPELDRPIRELVETYSKNIVYCGGVGSGNAIKCVNNYLNVSHLMLASDALLGLKSKGIDPATALKAINTSSGRSLQTEVRIPTEVMTGQYNYGFKLQLMRKDVLNAKSIVQEGLFFDAMTKPLVVPEHAASECDYTAIVHDLEKSWKVTLP